MNLVMLSVLSKAQLAQVSERDFQRAVIAHAEARGWKVFSIAKTGMMGADGKWKGMAGAGWVDIFGARGTHSIGWELKSERGTVKPAQRDWLAALEETGVQTGVYRPRDAEELMRRLR